MMLTFKNLRNWINFRVSETGTWRHSYYSQKLWVLLTILLSAPLILNCCLVAYRSLFDEEDRLLLLVQTHLFEHGRKHAVKLKYRAGDLSRASADNSQCFQCNMVTWFLDGWAKAKGYSEVCFVTTFSQPQNACSHTNTVWKHGQYYTELSDLLTSFKLSSGKRIRFWFSKLSTHKYHRVMRIEKPFVCLYFVKL